MKSLRLILWDDCNRQCKDCPNHGTEDAEVLDMGTLGGYDEILLTGGEPLLYPRRLTEVIQEIRAYTLAPIYVYTAMSSPVDWFIRILKQVDGITLTLYNRTDVRHAGVATGYIKDQLLYRKSLRLNTFGVDVPKWMTKVWDHNRKVFIEDCVLPANETLRRWHEN